MRFFCACVWLGLLLAAAPAAAQSSAANSPESAAWTAVSNAAFDSAKSAQVENITLVRDRIRITLVRGTIEFAKPAEGKVFGASFRGTGRIEVVPPSKLEEQQLELFTGQKILRMSFSQATFCFNDDTYAEVARQVKWSPASDDHLARLYLDRQQTREDEDAAQVLPRLFQAVLSTNTTHDAYFYADLKTDHFGWVEASDDAAQLENVTIGRWLEIDEGMIFDTWMEFPAWNRSPKSEDQHPLADDNYHVDSYRIDATVTAGAKLSATSTLSLRELEPGERVLLFNLDANLRVSSVRDVSGRLLPFFQPRPYGNRDQTFGSYLGVVLPKPTVAGATAVLTFRYSGKHVIRRVGPGNYFCPSYGWYPSPNDNFATRSKFLLTFHAPDRFTLAATGEQVSKKKDGKEIVTQWKSSQPLTVAGFAFGDYKQFDTKVGKATVQILANAHPNEFLQGIQQALNPDLPGSDPGASVPVGTLNPSETIKTMGNEVSNCLRLFDDYFGQYPYQKLTVTNIPYSYGQGWPTLIYLSALSFLDATQRHVLGLPDNYELTDYFRAHETSHQWWGQLVGWDTYHDQWLSEGFAQFSGNLYVEFREGPKQFLERLKEDKQALLAKNRYGHVYDSLGPVWMGQRLSSSLAPRGYDVVVYKKGGWILNMLRMMMWNGRSKHPDARFKAMMHDYTSTYANKSASTEDFEAVVNKYMTPVMDLDHDHRMDWFFRQYVYGTGIPDYTFSYKIAGAPAGKWRITGSVTRTGVPANWEDILPLYVHFGNRQGRIGWISARQPVTHFSFDLPEKPDKLSLNDDQEILATIHQ